jgi:hypothetical protein
LICSLLFQSQSPFTITFTMVMRFSLLPIVYMTVGKMLRISLGGNIIPSTPTTRATLPSRQVKHNHSSGLPRCREATAMLLTFAGLPSAAEVVVVVEERVPAASSSGADSQ